MLLLSRDIGQRTFIGDDITVMVCKIEHGRVVLGIDAPPDIRILREEIKTKQDTKDVERS